MCVVIKRDSTLADFEPSKIEAAILKAMPFGEGVKPKIAKDIANEIYEDAKDKEEITVYDIEEAVFNKLISKKQRNTARAYESYRSVREYQREVRNTIDDNIYELLDGYNDELKNENSNKDYFLNTTKRDYMAGEVSKDITKRWLLPPDIVDAHEKGLIHFHDADYFAQHLHNCDLLNIDDMLQNGTVISETLIEKPHSFSVACNVTTQIIAQVASNQYGGQSVDVAALAPFVDVSRQNIKKDVIEEFGEERTDIIEKRLRKEVKAGVQTIQYQILTLLTTNGQTPFVTLFLYLDAVEEGQTRDDLAMIIEEILNQRMQGVKNEKGVWITPAFPKLIYCLDEDNIHEDSKYYYLTELAARCSAKRLVPDYISAKMMKKLKGDVYTCMGCRSFLTPDRFTDTGIGNIAKAKNYEPGKHKYYGRFNQGVVTINLVDVALSSGGDYDLFWEIFDERLDLCYRALMIRHKRLLGTPSDAAPILWQYGALARLEKGETIDPLLFNGYSTISLGYAGLYECVKYMTGESHTSEVGKPFALQVMQHMNDMCNKWKAETNIDFSLYGSPIESTTYKFAKCLQDRFGKIPGITDYNYITNSYHVNVRENIDAFTKLAFESEFQTLSPGGAISYCETPNMQNNIPAVMSVIKFIYDNIMYAELNTKSDYCQVCGYDGEIQIKEDADKKLYWECPNCGNRDENKLNIARRTCGYIGSQFWNQGRTQEIKDRVLHL